ncbi:glycosyltransferase family 2 protein [Polynucleobacter kasalickyi]|uniref:Glycosyltransferase involved in cell wall bisynthesis n=1 Tax=Polynucleobacter kasalickyi TaxID=1938817 RepID=A0A1W2BRF5_9BURK|nr:glycosyltransferase family 2 protein [Polynucleobacter kasalickyi]SMC75451.1 Glycosyltransferase involved in cell wall bisynthesis [Polynucleobacter kasalickyi]
MPINPSRLTNFSLSVVVPAYNESTNLIKFVETLRLTVSKITPVYEIIIINDGSRDNTDEIGVQLAQENSIRYLSFSRNFGKEAALSAGIDHARGDAVLLIDADFQHPMEKLSEMCSLWQSGYDMVYGVIVDRGNESFLKRFGTRFFYSLMSAGTDVPIPQNAGDFRWLDRKVVNALKMLPERNRFMKGLYAWVGFKSIGMPFIPADRFSGVSSFKLTSLIKLALSGITAFSTLPLRLWTFIGGFISLVAISYAIYVVFDTLIYGNPVGGWPTITVALMLFSGVQLLSIGILGEYIGRIFDEVKQRPLYLIAKDHDNSSLDS